MKKDQVEHVKHSLQSTIVGVGQISERRDRVEKKSTENFSSFPHSKHTQRSNEITQLAVSGAHSIKRKFLSIKNGWIFNYLGARARVTCVSIRNGSR